MTKWPDMTPEEKGRLVHEKIMGLDSGASYDPLPDYTQNMDAAWLVLQKIAARFNEKDEHMDEIFYQFRLALLKDSGDEIYPATDLLLDMAEWTPEIVCLAALRAVGQEV